MKSTNEDIDKNRCAARIVYKNKDGESVYRQCLEKANKKYTRIINGQPVMVGPKHQAPVDIELYQKGNVPPDGLILSTDMSSVFYALNDEYQDILVNYLKKYKEVAGDLEKKAQEHKTEMDKKEKEKEELQKKILALTKELSQEKGSGEEIERKNAELNALADRLAQLKETNRLLELSFEACNATAATMNWSLHNAFENLQIKEETKIASMNEESSRLFEEAKEVARATRARAEVRQQEALEAQRYFLTIIRVKCGKTINDPRLPIVFPLSRQNRPGEGGQVGVLFETPEIKFIRGDGRVISIKQDKDRQITIFADNAYNSCIMDPFKQEKNTYVKYAKSINALEFLQAKNTASKEDTIPFKKALHNHLTGMREFKRLADRFFSDSKDDPIDKYSSTTLFRDLKQFVDEQTSNENTRSIATSEDLTDKTFYLVVDQQPQTVTKDPNYMLAREAMLLYERAELQSYIGLASRNIEFLRDTEINFLTLQQIKNLKKNITIVALGPSVAGKTNITKSFVNNVLWKYQEKYKDILKNTRVEFRFLEYGVRGEVALGAKVEGSLCRLAILAPRTRKTNVIEDIWFNANRFSGQCDTNKGFANLCQRKAKNATWDASQKTNNSCEWFWTDTGRADELLSLFSQYDAATDANRQTRVTPMNKSGSSRSFKVTTITFTAIIEGKQENVATINVLDTPGYEDYTDESLQTFFQVERQNLDRFEDYKKNVKDEMNFIQTELGQLKTTLQIVHRAAHRDVQRKTTITGWLGQTGLDIFPDECITILLGALKPDIEDNDDLKSAEYYMDFFDDVTKAKDKR